MTDQLEQRLTETGRRWQSTQPAPPAVPLDRLDDPEPRRLPPWRWVAAAAAVVVVAGGLVAATVGRHDGGGPVTTGPGTVHVVGPVGQAVPFAGLPAGHPDVRHREHGHVVTPYDRVSATGAIVGDARPGDTLVFIAVLESSTDLPLDPCPDYNIAFGRSYWHTWQLNCAQVPYRDAQGRPYLPAFKNVRFEMHVTVPDEPGRQKVLWTLDGPQQMPGFYGIVRVR